ncbi:MAG: hypothetical protein WBA16_01160 [Nonlabens sp.]
MFKDNKFCKLLGWFSLYPALHMAIVYASYHFKYEPVLLGVYREMFTLPIMLYLPVGVILNLIALIHGRDRWRNWLGFVNCLLLLICVVYSFT